MGTEPCAFPCTGPRPNQPRPAGRKGGFLTSHADAHDGQHGTHDHRQEDQEHDHVIAEQDSPSTVQLPSVPEIQGQDA